MRLGIIIQIKKSIDDLIAILYISLLNYDDEQIKKAHFSPIRISTEAIVNICKKWGFRIL
jgi:hypothetical protein